MYTKQILMKSATPLKALKAIKEELFVWALYIDQNIIQWIFSRNSLVNNDHK